MTAYSLKHKRGLGPPASHSASLIPFPSHRWGKRGVRGNQQGRLSPCLLHIPSLLFRCMCWETWCGRLPRGWEPESRIHGSDRGGGDNDDGGHSWRTKAVSKKSMLTNRLQDAVGLSLAYTCGYCESLQLWVCYMSLWACPQLKCFMSEALPLSYPSILSGNWHMHLLYLNSAQVKKHLWAEKAGKLVFL